MVIFIPQLIDTKPPDSMSVMVMFTHALRCSGVLTERKDIVITSGHCVAGKMLGKKRICKKPKATNTFISYQ